MREKNPKTKHFFFYISLEKISSGSQNKILVSVPGTNTALNLFRLFHYLFPLKCGLSVVKYMFQSCHVGHKESFF